MSQSAVLIATLFAAFVLYVAARGRLADYATALLGAAPKSTAGGSSSGGGLGSDLKKGADIATTAAKVAAVFG